MPSLCHLCLVFVWPSLCRVLVCLCLGFVFVLVFVFSLSSLLLSCLVLVLSCLVLSALCVVLGVAWGHFLSSRESFGVIFGRLGGRLKLLGWSWAALGKSWRLLKRSWSELTPQGGPYRFHGRSCIGFWTHLGRQKGAKTEPKTTKIRSNNYLKKRSRFRSVLRPSWGDLGAILDPSCGPKDAPNITPADIS